MKKLKWLLLLLLVLPFNIYASGSILPNKQNLSMTIGDTTSFGITASNAAGRVDISVSDSNIISINTTEVWIENETSLINVSGKAIGSATIYVKITDAATFDMEELPSTTYSINVSVTDKPAVPKDTRSANNNLKALNIEGYEPTKIDNNNYLLIVNNNITNINVNAISEDDKATIIGNGNKEIIIGENHFEIIITAENGRQNKYNLNVVRKDGRYLSELSTALAEEDDVSILLLEGEVIKESDLELVRNAQKKVTFNYYDLNKKLLYSWIVDGKTLNNITKIDTKVNFESKNQKEMYKLSNYADGKYISFDHTGALPDGVKLKLYVADTFEDKDKVFAYYYDKEGNRLQTYRKDLTVNNGYIEFDISHTSDFFISMSNLKGEQVEYKNSSKMVVLCIVEGVVILGLGYAFFTLFIGNKSKK